MLIDRPNTCLHSPDKRVCLKGQGQMSGPGHMAVSSGHITVKELKGYRQNESTRGFTRVGRIDALQ